MEGNNNLENSVVANNDTQNTNVASTNDNQVVQNSMIYGEESDAPSVQTVQSSAYSELGIQNAVEKTQSEGVSLGKPASSATNMQQENMTQAVMGGDVNAQQSTVQNPYVQQPMNQQPIGQNPYVQQPMNQQPMGQNPYVQQPMNQQPTVQNPYVQQPMNQQPMNQQPMNQQPIDQNPYAQQGNMGMPNNFVGNEPHNNKPKKGKKGLIIGIIFIILVAAIVTVGVLIAQGKLSIGVSSAEKKLEKSQKLFQEEMSSYSTGIEEKIDLDAMSKFYEENPTHFDLDVVADVPEYGNAGLSFDVVSDKKNKQGKIDLGVSSQGFNLEVGEIIVDSNALYVSAPLLSDDVYYIDMSNFKEDYANSIWPKVLELELPEDFDVESFANPSDAMEDAEIIELGKKYADQFKKIRTVKLNDNSKEIAVGNELMSCKGVSIVYEKDKLTSTFQSYWEEYMDTEYCQAIIENSVDESVEQLLEEIGNITLEQDLVVNVYFDSKGRIVNVSTPDKIKMSGFRIDGFSFDFSFFGDKRAVDKIDGKFYLYAGTESLYIKLARTAELTKDIYNDLWNISLGDDTVGDEIVLTYKNDYDKTVDTFDIELTAESDDEKYAITIDGAFTDIVKGESYAIDIDKIAVFANDIEVMTMTATIKQGKATEDIELPTDYVNVWEMKESDLKEAY